LFIGKLRISGQSLERRLGKGESQINISKRRSGK
jgi:hypothetical protein